MTGSDIAIVGVAMTKFGKHAETPLKELGGQAVMLALKDAKLEIADIQMAFVANAMASVVTGQVSAVGQGILRASGFSGIPVFNIDNACAGSSSALNLAIHAIRSAAAETVLVLGVEKLVSDDRSRAYVALNGAADLDTIEASGIDPAKESVFVAAIYPERLSAYERRYGLARQTLAKIAVKNRAHAAFNPQAQFTAPLTIEEVLSSRQIVGPVTALMCAPIGDGAAAIVLTGAKRVSRSQRPVWVLGSAVGMGAPPGAESSIKRVAARAYEQAKLAPDDIDLAEVHDSISFNELLAYEELGFCEPGQGARLVDAGVTSIGGRRPINTSGGLESRGHPVAATGAAQIAELTMQLRGEADKRQVSGALYALAENAGGFAIDDTAAIAITILGASG
jgi:acetyl-CoA acyltransferase